MKRWIDGSWQVGLASVVMVASIMSCGGSTSASASPGASIPSARAVALASPKTTAAPASCPTGARVGSALGIVLPKPIGVPPTGASPLPAGVTGEVCDYHAATYNVIIERLTNVSPSVITQFSSKFPIVFTTVAGVGDQARAFSVSLGDGKDNEGVVATKGTTLVAIIATATPSSLAQIEAMVNQLL